MTKGRQAPEKNLLSELLLHRVQTRSVCHLPAWQYCEPPLWEGRAAALLYHLNVQPSGYKFKGEILDTRGLQNAELQV